MSEKSGVAAGKRRPGRPPRALDAGLDKQEALLDAAAMEFNAHGVSGASLTRIARAVGVTRAALYYYFESREDLAYRCYLRACELTAADLAAAARANGLASLQALIARTLDPQRPASVVLSEIHVLGAERRALIAAAHGRNVATLQGFVRSGIKDGSMRQCDAEVIAQTIVGILSWVPLAEEWSAGSGDTVHRHAADALSDLIADGIAAAPKRPFVCTLDAMDHAPKPSNPFDRGQAAAAKVETLARTASRLFNRRGIDGTSLDQITLELGATKGAFYQYIRDKTSLVVHCHQRAMVLAEAFADAAERHGASGMERSLLGMHLLVQAYAGELSPLAPLTGLEALPAKPRAQLRNRGLALQRRYERFNRSGLADGSMRPFDMRTISTTGAGVFSWIPKWHGDDDARTPRAVADEVVALFHSGLRRR